MKPFKTVKGTYWRADGAGWQLRKSGKQDDPNKDKYLGLLSGTAYRKMKSEFPGNKLIEAFTTWVQMKAAKKGIQLN